MNIVILQGAFLPIPPLLGGAVEKMWYKLGQEFARLGHHVTHISRQYPGLPDEKTVDGVYHKRIPSYAAPRSVIKYKLLDAIYSWRAVRALPMSTDLVVTNSFWSPIFLYKNKRAAVYVDVARMPKGQLRLYVRADCLRANSSAVVAAIKAELHEAAHSRIGLVPNPLPFNLREVVNLTAKEPVILYCGRVHEEKGLELLAKAVNLFDLHEWHIQIAGPWEVGMRNVSMTLLHLAS